MNFPLYNSMRKLIQKPHDRYTTDLQALVNNRWENSTQTSFNVWMETEIGTGNYEQVDVSVDTAVDIGTGFKKGDDFKVFSLKNISREIILGTMFFTDTDYWICVNTNGFASPTNSCEVRRCNNTLAWIDPSTGVVKHEPCIIDYELSSPRPRHDKDIDVADGHIFVIVQGSEITRAIEKNQRFILSGQPYKLSAIQSLLDTRYFATNPDIENSTLLYLDMYLDMIQPDDDLVSNVANVDDYQYRLNIQPSYNEIANRIVPNAQFDGILVPTVTTNDGDVTGKSVVLTGNEYVDIQVDGKYKLTGNVGDVARITTTVGDNPNISEITAIRIMPNPNGENNDVLIVNPLYTVARQHQPVYFSVGFYRNGEPQWDEEVTWTYAGLDESYFSLTQHYGNNFMLAAKKFSTTPLQLTFSAGGLSKTITIQLQPLF